MKKCSNCGKDIHPKRLEILPNTHTCVDCSNTGKKAGVSVVMGEGDHTYNETIIMDPDEYQQVKALEQRLYGVRKDDIPHPDEEIEEDEDEEINELEGIDEIKKIDFEDLENLQEE